MKKDSDILTANQAAALLKISRSTFQRLIERGTVKPLDQPNPLLKRQPLRFSKSAIEKLRPDKPAT